VQTTAPHAYVNAPAAGFEATLRRHCPHDQLAVVKTKEMKHVAAIDRELNAWGNA
jgi:hypothetical protein